MVASASFANFLREELAPLGHIVLRNLRDGGFRGALYAVNPKGGRILDTPTYTEVGGIPEPVDLAVVAVPAAAVPEVAEQCGRHGVKALVVIAAGRGRCSSHHLTRTAQDALERGMVRPGLATAISDHPGTPRWSVS